MNSELSSLAELGWKAAFSSQLTDEDRNGTVPARVAAVHRDRLDVLGDGFAANIIPSYAQDEGGAATVGDWLLMDPVTKRVVRVLERVSLLKRRAAGTERRLQLLAANIDTLFIVSSCNQDFNLARLERYLALARESQVTPVVVLTKADMAEEPRHYADAAAWLLTGLLVEAIDARDPHATASLVPWCGLGQTVALLGSSGVGKSTLSNTLTGQNDIATQGIREDDARGRHTTTGRAMHRLPAGGWLIDTPGMRELQLTDASDGVADLFTDVLAAAGACRFSNCQHDGEPGCAVQAAIADGSLDATRVKRWRKLVAEEAFNSESLAEKRERSRAFGKMSKRAMAEKRSRNRPD